MKPRRTPSPPNGIRRLACPDSVLWTMDSGGTVVIDERRGQVHVLHGLESAVWSWLSLGYSFTKLVSFAAEFLTVSREEAQDYLTGLLDGWVGAGLLEEGPGSGSQVEPMERRPVEEGGGGG